MNIQQCDVSKIEKAYYNPRKELKKGDDTYNKIQRSIEAFGCVDPIVVNDVNMRCVGGHQRLQVMIDMGYTEVPCSFIHIEDEAKEKSLNIALNKIKGQFDNRKLEDLINELDDYNFDLSLTGFDEADLEYMLQTVDVEDIPSTEEETKQLESVKEQNAVCKIHNLSFKVERELYLKTMNEIKVEHGFSDDAIIAELRRRILSDTDC